MKKILIILLMILSLSLVSCSDKYEKIYNLDNEIEIVEILSEAEVKEYLEECNKVLETLNYITYEGMQYVKKDASESDDSIKEYTEIIKGKFQRNAKIQFVFEYYATETSVEGEAKVVSDYKTYGKDEKLYIQYKSGEKIYTCGRFSRNDPLWYFDSQLCGGGLDAGYLARRTYGIDKEGNLICYEKSKFNEQDYILITVYDNYKLVYREWRMVEGDQIVYWEKESFAYDWFITIKNSLKGYEHSRNCIGSKHD